MARHGTLSLRSPHERMRLLLAGGAALLAALTLVSLLLTPPGTGIRQALWWEEAAAQPSPSATAGLASGIHATAVGPSATATPGPPRTTRPAAARTTGAPAIAAATTAATPAPPPTQAPPVTFTGTVEAEAATFANGSRSVDCGFCSGNHKAGWIGFGASVTFAAVRVPTTRTYNLTITYVGEDRAFYVSVNGGSGNRLWISNGDWSRTRSLVVSVRLTAGIDNKIAFSNRNDWAPDLDKISIS